MDTQRDPDTDPRADEKVPAVFVPYTIGEVRTVANETRIAAEMIARLTSGDLASHARMLASHATRLGQAANLLSAVAVPPVPVVIPPPVRGWAKVRAMWILFRA